MRREVVILGGARTPFGTFGGSLKEVSAVELGVIASKAALERSGVDPARVDNVVFGNVIHSSSNAPYLARHIALKSGVGIHAPALTVNRLCGSGLQAVISAAKDIVLGESEIALAGGSENMSQSPYVLRNARFGMRMGNATTYDALTEALTDEYAGIGMGITAENLAAKYAISREEQDRFALRSQQLAAAAREKGRFRQEIAPVSVSVKGKTVAITEDEHIRPQTTMEALASLKPAFQKEGTVTAGNASGINDGAAALVLASREAADRIGAAPMARIVSWGVSGVEPDIMGIGPVNASRQALERAGLALDHMDLIEVNEAFAAQYLAVEKELGLDRNKVNVNGGAIALGHPIGASGARVLLTLLHELKNRGLRYGLATLCIGGGQGIAVVVETL